MSFGCCRMEVRRLWRILGETGGENMAIHRSGRLVEDWCELEESGTPLEPLEFRVGLISNGGVTIRQYDAPYERGIRELSSGRVAYVLPVFIRRDDPGRTIIRDCSLDVPWDDSIEWLEEDKRRNRGWYTFWKNSYPPMHEYAREIVLNHRMICTLWRGAFREGLLLAVGKVRPPETYRDGDIIPITLTILDQWDCKPSAIFKLRLERCRALDEKNMKSKRGPLYSRPDPKPVATKDQPELGPVKKSAVKPFDPYDQDQRREYEENMRLFGEEVDRLYKEALAKEKNESETPQKITPELASSAGSRRGAGARKVKSPA
jgi:hypothetical protein